MRITILTAGSQGYGVTYAPLPADIIALPDSPERQAVKSGNPVKAMQTVWTTVAPMLREIRHMKVMTPQRL